MLVAACCLVITAAADVPWGGESPRPRAQVYALEGLGALGGLAGCALGAGCGYSLLASAVAQGPHTEGDMMGVGIVVAGVSAVALPACAGYGVSKVGAELGEDGSRTLAIVGAYAGVPAGAVMVLLGAVAGLRGVAVGISCYVLGGLAIPVGAVIGYNLGIKREATSFHLGSRLQVPGVTLASVELPDHSVEYGVKVHLAGLRF